MDVFTTTDLQELLGDEDLCVSIYLPTHRGRPQRTEEDPLRLKNLLRGVQDQLAARGLRSAQVEDLLEPVRRLKRDESFWRHVSDGLALFRSPRRFRSFRVPMALPELGVVNERFHVTPLLPLLTINGRFYVLALSQGSVRLLQGTRLTVDEVALEGVPRSLAEALRFDEDHKQLQFHTGAPPAGPGGRAAVFFGNAREEEDAKERIRLWFKQVDEAMRSFLADAGAPVVLAGVEYLLPLYREVTSLPHVLDQGITGNPETLRPAELHEQAWHVVEPHFRARVDAAVAEHGRLQGNGRAISGVTEVVRAAGEGRVATLLTVADGMCWGHVEPDGTVVVREEPEPGDEDLVNLAALRTLAHKGEVFTVEPGGVPGGGPVAALLRY